MRLADAKNIELFIILLNIISKDDKLGEANPETDFSSCGNKRKINSKEKLVSNKNRKNQYVKF